MRLIVAIAAMFAPVAPASAEVVSSNPNGFHLRQVVTVTVPPAAAFASFAQVERWWSPSHSYSGNAKSLSLKPTPGGCFCEQMPGGGVAHMRVVYADAPKKLVMTGGLGPLLYQAVTGVMEISIESARRGSKVTMDYKVAGFATGGADKMSAPVDGVLAEQMKRFAAFAGTQR